MTGLAHFRSPETVVHHDIVYAAGSPVGIARAYIVKGDGRRVTVIRDGRYMLW